jgi:hypothetical protein
MISRTTSGGPIEIAAKEFKVAPNRPIAKPTK